MLVRLKGINTVRKKLADGTTATYFYHRLTGERLKGKPGTPEFQASIAAAEDRRKAVPSGIFRAVIAAYRRSTNFTDRAPKTRKDYERYLRMIELEFGDAELGAISDPRMRGDFLEWRDGLAERSRRGADYAMAVLSAVLAFGVDSGKISANRAEKAGRLYEADRADKVWTTKHIAAFTTEATPELQLALTLAMHTGQRQGDLLKLSWGNYDGNTIRLRQSKGGRTVAIKCGSTLKRILDSIPRTASVILTTSTGRPWKADHFRHEWAAATKAAGIVDLHFHDLRGTAVTLMSEAGSNPQEIATITGWSYASVETILERYSSRSVALSETAALRLERALARTYGDQILQTKLQTGASKRLKNAS